MTTFFPSFSHSTSTGHAEKRKRKHAIWRGFLPTTNVLASGVFFIFSASHWGKSPPNTGGLGACFGLGFLCKGWSSQSGVIDEIIPWRTLSFSYGDHLDLSPLPTDFVAICCCFFNGCLYSSCSLCYLLSNTNDTSMLQIESSQKLPTTLLIQIFSPPKRRAPRYQSHPSTAGI
ncbi:hypothetical protein J3F83DRAFT_226187 [Trichoderma novae-zelandiae]